MLKQVLWVMIWTVGLLAPVASSAEQEAAGVALKKTSVERKRDGAKGEPERGTLAYLDARNGFLDVTFGDDIKMHQADLVLVQKGHVDYYVRKHPLKMLGDAELAGVGYGFHKNKLIVVEVRTKGQQNNWNLLRVLRDNYGWGETIDSADIIQHSRSWWSGNVVRVTYEMYIPAGEATTQIMNISLYQKMKNDREKGAGDVKL